MNDDNARAAVVAAARRMVTGGLTEHTSGNVSCRVDTTDASTRFAITPHGLDYFEMEPVDVVVIDAEGDPVDDDSTRIASVEKTVHLAIYAARPDVEAIMHSHPVHVQMLAVARRPLPSIIDEAWVELGPEVRVAEYGISGSDDLAAKIVAALGNDRAALMASHGLITAGRDLDHVVSLSELIEHLCRVYVGSVALGGPAELSDDAQNLYRAVYEYVRQQEDEKAIQQA